MSTQTATQPPLETPGPAAALPSGEELLRRRLLDVLLASPEPGKMTYEEFLAWADEDTLAEWVDGDIVMTSPASDPHQDLADFLTALLRIYVETHELGWVRSAPFQMKPRSDLPGREPDVLFLAKEHLGRLKLTYLDGPADLVVEIISPESIGRDRGEKFAEYEAGGVPEYWLIDPLREWAEFYRLEEGHYRLAFAGREGEYQALVVPGFWLRAEWLWQEPLPHPLRTLGEIAGLDPETVEGFLQALRSQA